MNTDRVIASLLEDAAVDYVGLYEIVWDLNRDYPDESAAAKIAAARKIVRELLEARRAVLYQTGEWPPKAFEPVSPKDEMRLVESDSAFEVPNEGTPPRLFWIMLNSCP